MELRTIKDDEVAKIIRSAQKRAVYAAPGVTDTVAGALIEARKRQPEVSFPIVRVCIRPHGSL